MWRHIATIFALGLVVSWLFDFVARVRLLEKKIDEISKGRIWPWD